jgi:N-acyl-D-amino-acid deacylase
MTLRMSILLSVGFLVGSFASWPIAAQDPVKADVLLSGGTIYDGAGGEGFVGDVAIRGGKIVAVGKFEKGAVGLTVDCRGLYVTPGYIDLHNHSDRGMVEAATRANVNYLTQGCTTIVTGNCGSGPVDVEKYFASIDTSGAGTNVIHLLPHGSLRTFAGAGENREPTSDELKKMCELAEKAMQDGAWGMSTGLIYVPGTYAKTNEIAEVAKVVGANGGIYASHIRNEGTDLVQSVQEAMEIGRKGKCPVHISHYKSSGRKAWGGVRAAAEAIEKARAAGEKVTADQYPYIASSTSLSAMTIPSWALEGGNKALVKRLDDPVDGPKIRAEIQDRIDDRNRMVVASYSPKIAWVGKSVDEIAELEKRPAVDIVVEIMRGGGAAAVNFGMNEEDVRFAMQLPWVATASDGSSKLPSEDRPHPRSYGTFSRKIGRYAIQDKVLSVEAAVRSSSGLPADILSLTDRGYLKAGLAADVTVFDPKQFIDKATFEDPFQYSAGIRYVFVNGEPALFNGTPTGALAGKALRHLTAKNAAETK